jgi:SAM-dependent methyltransferase
MSERTSAGSGTRDPAVGYVREHLVDFFTERVEKYGSSHEAVDWNSAASQELRFSQLTKVCDPSRQYSLIDYGCGYGALARYLADRGDRFSYQGFDMTPAMVEQARASLADLPGVSLTSDPAELQPADYVIACGVFSMKLDASDEAWQDYVLRTLDELASLSTRGFAFNSLTSYSDPPRMRPDLYYPDPGFYFDHCKRHFARNVALLHDYDLYEFTIIVRFDHAGASASERR